MTSQDAARAAYAAAASKPLVAKRSIPPPPRKLSPTLYLNLVFGKARGAAWTLLFVASIGLFLVSMSGISDTALLTFFGETAKGRVLSVGPTSWSEDDYSVYEVRFEFTAGGRAFEGSAYGLEAPFDPGDECGVVYCSFWPTSSTIPGMRSRLLADIAGSIILAVVLFSVLWNVWSIDSGRKNVQLIRHGLLTVARLVGHRTSGENDTNHHLTFQFQDDTGATRQTVINTTSPQALIDDEQEEIVFLPGTEVAVPLDDLPCKPTFHEDGRATGGMNVVALFFPYFLTAGAVFVLLLWSYVL